MEYSTEFLTKSGVVLGPTGNRRWPKRVKASIVAETLEPGASVSGVAARWGIGANMLSTWRGMAKRGELVLPALPLAEEEQIEFASLSLLPSAEGPGGGLGSTPIEIAVGPAVLRLPGDSSANRIAQIMLAIGSVRP